MDLSFHKKKKKKRTLVYYPKWLTKKKKVIAPYDSSIIGCILIFPLIPFVAGKIPLSLSLS
jgi:phenolic acid decarboxylase